MPPQSAPTAFAQPARAVESRPRPRVPARSGSRYLQLAGAVGALLVVLVAVFGGFRAQPASGGAPAAAGPHSPTFEDREQACAKWNLIRDTKPAEDSVSAVYFRRSAAEIRGLAVAYAALPDVAAAANAEAQAREDIAAGGDIMLLDKANVASRWVCGDNAVAIIPGPNAPDPSTLELTRPAGLPAAAPGTDFSDR